MENEKFPDTPDISIIILGTANNTDCSSIYSGNISDIVDLMNDLDDTDYTELDARSDPVDAHILTRLEGTGW
ncbi:uncharacterized protein PRCAT00004856001 [Priceomyces carsonii]|uniref:uncharacterized protein n=1 Tax=Priceomyces carsonii TaxID=28549 RepID=UPI002EDB494B|nr:unnamed protein product [Priceomyces carsonii]